MNKRRKKVNKTLDTVLGNQPPSPISELERRVAQLEKDVAVLKRRAEWPGPFSDVPAEKKVKPGLKERIDDDLLFKCRDGLIRWLEAYWPWMEARLLGAESAEEVGAILEAVSEEPDFRRDWQKRLLPNPGALFDFITHRRFTRNLPMTTLKDALNGRSDDQRCRRAANRLPTRQIANAMAGIPDIGWRRSLDRCSAHPSKAPIPVTMDMFYRDKYGIDAPKNWDLTGASCPVPKPLQPVLSRSGDDISKRSQPKITMDRPEK